MTSVRYTIRLLGMKSREGTIPLVALRDIAESILSGSERALRLSVEGASTRRGRAPEWVRRSLEVTVTGIGRGSTVLEIEAPTLHESAPEQVQQRHLWYTRPNPEDTAIGVLAKSVSEIKAENLESAYYDQGVLAALAEFRPLLENYLKTIEITSEDRPRDSFSLMHDDVMRVARLRKSIREPQAVVVSGLFNLIEHAERRFQLVQEDGHKIFGKAESGFISDEDMRNLWGGKVTVKGTAYYSPSGRIRLIEGHVVKPFEPGEQVFESIPELASPLRIPQTGKGRRSPLREIQGRWPGEEPVEAILSTLKEISREG